jgi:hypothetical protein
MRKLEIARRAIERLSDYGHCVCEPNAVYPCDYCVAEEGFEALASIESEVNRIGNALARESAKPGGTWDEAHADQLAAEVDQLATVVQDLVVTGDWYVRVLHDLVGREDERQSTVEARRLWEGALGRAREHIFNR